MHFYLVTICVKFDVQSSDLLSRPLKAVLSQLLQRITFKSMQHNIDILKRFFQEFKVAQKFALISFIILNQI